MSATKDFLNSKAGMTTAGIVVVAMVGYLIVRALGKKAGEAVAAVGQAVNPTSDQNLAYQGVNSVGRVLTGDQSFSLGSWLYDLTHEAYDPNKPVERLPIKRQQAQKFLDLTRGADAPVILRQSTGN
jgi:hypothetical protein